MVRNKFVAAQQSCDLRRHLDGVAPEASIGDIVDSCHIWESHAEPIAIDNWWQDPVYSQPTLLMPPPVTCGSARLQYRVGNVMPASNESHWRVMHSLADRELLIRNVLEALGTRRNVNSKRSRSRALELLLLRDMPPVGSVTEEKTSPPAVQPAEGTPPLTDDLWDRGQCFSGGFHGHGVNRCSQLDISFPYEMPGWSVNVRNGQYRASRMRGDGHDSRRGKEGWFGREGQPPGPSMTVTHLTQVGVIIRLGNDRWITLIDPDEPRTPMVSQHWGSSLRLEKKRCDRAIPYSGSAVVAWNLMLDPILRSKRYGGHRAPLGRNVSTPRRGMRPAGINGPARRMAPVGGSDVKESSAVWPLSVQAVEFSPALPQR